LCFTILNSGKQNKNSLGCWLPAHTCARRAMRHAGVWHCLALSEHGAWPSRVSPRLHGRDTRQRLAYAKPRLCRVPARPRATRGWRMRASPLGTTTVKTPHLGSLSRHPYLVRLVKLAPCRLKSEPRPSGPFFPSRRRSTTLHRG
jgi:hypothetical protein